MKNSAMQPMLFSATLITGWVNASPIDIDYAIQIQAADATASVPIDERFVAHPTGKFNTSSYYQLGYEQCARHSQVVTGLT